LYDERLSSHEQEEKSQQWLKEWIPKLLQPSYRTELVDGVCEEILVDTNTPPLQMSREHAAEFITGYTIGCGHSLRQNAVNEQERIELTASIWAVLFMNPGPMDVVFRSLKTVPPCGIAGMPQLSPPLSVVHDTGCDTRVQQNCLKRDQQIADAMANKATAIPETWVVSVKASEEQVDSIWKEHKLVRSECMRDIEEKVVKLTVKVGQIDAVVAFAQKADDRDANQTFHGDFGYGASGTTECLTNIAWVGNNPNLSSIEIIFLSHVVEAILTATSTKDPTIMPRIYLAKMLHVKLETITPEVLQFLMPKFKVTAIGGAVLSMNKQLAHRGNKMASEHVAKSGIPASESSEINFPTWVTGSEFKDWMLPLFNNVSPATANEWVMIGETARIIYFTSHPNGLWENDSKSESSVTNKSCEELMLCAGLRKEWERHADKLVAADVGWWMDEHAKAYIEMWPDSLTPRLWTPNEISYLVTLPPHRVDEDTSSLSEGLEGQGMGKRKKKGNQDSESSLVAKVTLPWHPTTKKQAMQALTVVQNWCLQVHTYNTEVLAAQSDS
jgi:hypothetical protein